LPNPLIAIALSPVLLVQGIAVRKRVPRLPEPPGPRQGTTGKGKPLRLLIAGDSAAAGVGAPHQDEALSGQLVSRLAQRFRVDWKLLARTGATTASTLAGLRGLEQQSCDVAITSLGVNDVTTQVGLDEWLTQQHALWETLKNHFSTRLIIVSGLPPVHSFPALPQPLRWYLGRRATQFDRALTQAVENHDSNEFLNLRFSGKPTDMASDGFHPGPPVYAEWARRAAELITNAF
jgi:lysophospholipase L1-like esterase